MEERWGGGREGGRVRSNGKKRRKGGGCEKREVVSFGVGTKGRKEGQDYYSMIIVHCRPLAIAQPGREAIEG